MKSAVKVVWFELRDDMAEAISGHEPFRTFLAVTIRRRRGFVSGHAFQVRKNPAFERCGKGTTSVVPFEAKRLRLQPLGLAGTCFE